MVGVNIEPVTHAAAFMLSPMPCDVTKKKASHSSHSSRSVEVESEVDDLQVLVPSTSRMHSLLVERRVLTPILKPMATPIKVYGHPISQPTRSIMMLVEEADVPHEFKLVDTFKGECKAPEFVKINPAGLVPCIQDGELSLGESAAILTYIAQSRTLSHWLPAEPDVQARVNFWMHWNHTNTRKSTMECVRPMFFGGTVSTDGFKQAVEFMEGRLAEAGPFLAGTGSPTIADLFILPEIDQLEEFKAFDYAPYPKVAAWLAAVKAALPKSYDKWSTALKDAAKQKEKSEVPPVGEGDEAEAPKSKPVVCCHSSWQLASGRDEAEVPEPKPRGC